MWRPDGSRFRTVFEPHRQLGHSAWIHHTGSVCPTEGPTHRAPVDNAVQHANFPSSTHLPHVAQARTGGTDLTAFTPGPEPGKILTLLDTPDGAAEVKVKVKVKVKVEVKVGAIGWATGWVCSTCRGELHGR
ncbi:hypothetical protein JCM16303_000771 [Sporobolomyces ruberrimus]